MKVSVVLSAYNAEEFIKEAIDSILNQTFSDFELIIINDGSKDGTLAVIQSFSDPRIVLINQENQGLIKSLNTGFSIAKGKYIARMDADDIALPLRLEKQVAFMDANPNCIVSGTQIEFFGNNKFRFPFRALPDNKSCKNWLVRLPCFAHPTVIIRREILEKNNLSYNVNYKNAEDYKLWIDMSPFGDFLNIQEVLLKYRLSENQITNQKNGLKEKTTKKCRKEYISKYFPEISLINLSIDDLKKAGENLYLKALIYFCLPKNFSLLTYFIYSLDWLKFDRYSSLAVLKSIMKREQRDYL